MNKKKFITLFPDTYNIHIHKDVGMIPHILKRDYDWDCEIVTLKNEKKYNFSKIPITTIPKLSKKTHSLINLISILTYLLFRSKNITILNLYHFTKFNSIISFFYKLLNPKGLVYIKLDYNIIDLKKSTNLNHTLWGKYLLRVVDLFSTETSLTFEFLNKTLFKNHSEKLIIVPNGFDKNEIVHNNINVKSYTEKENIIITVGRIGSYPKNNELLLNVLTEINLQDWKAYFIGPVEKEFEKSYADIIKKNPNLAENIQLTGPINDRKELLEYYNKAKIFCLTSLFEGFALVSLEALALGNYFITSNVGAAHELTQNNTIGNIFETKEELKLQLELLINNEDILFSNYSNAIQLFKSKYEWTKIIGELHYKLNSLLV